MQNQSNTKSVQMLWGSQEQGWQETSNFHAGGAGGVVIVECQEHTFLTEQLGSLFLPTTWLSWRFLEEGTTLWFAFQEQVAVMTKLQH